jgi:hypothetical protein
MVYRSYACPECDGRVEVTQNSVHDKVEPELQLYCVRCLDNRTFERVFEAPLTTFGMMSKQYSGQLAAVKGYGSYQLDYSNSDLARRRAVDATMEFNERSNLSHINKSLEQAIANERSEKT